MSNLTTPDLLKERLLTLSEACKKFPGSRGAARKHPATLTRYIRRGCLSINGNRVRLEAIRDGNRFLTSEEARPFRRRVHRSWTNEADRTS